MVHEKSMDQVTAFVALGANIGDRREQLRGALMRLADLDGVCFDLTRDVAPLYESSPVAAFGDQGDYLNSAVRILTTRTPGELLDGLLAIEAGMGRTRTARGAARIVDLDLLMYGNEEIRQANLVVPHPRMQERRFVLEPLATLAPNWQHPRSGKSIQALRREVEKREPGQAIREVAGKSWAIDKAFLGAGGCARLEGEGHPEGCSA